MIGHGCFCSVWSTIGSHQRLIMFTGKAMRHLIAESGVGQIMIGTD